MNNKTFIDYYRELRAEGYTHTEAIDVAQIQISSNSQTISTPINISEPTSAEQLLVDGVIHQVTTNKNLSITELTERLNLIPDTHHFQSARTTVSSRIQFLEDLDTFIGNMPEYSIHINTGSRTFESKITGAPVTYEGAEITFGWDNPITINAEESAVFRRWLAIQSFENNIDDYGTVYQITFDNIVAQATHDLIPNMHLNAHWGNLQELLNKHLETYEGADFIFTGITFHTTNRQHFDNIPIDAGYGEGFSVKLDDKYWLLDLAPTKTHCVLNAFVTWLHMRKGKLNDVIGWTTRKHAHTGKTQRVRKLKVLTNNYRQKHLLNMTQMQQIEKHNMLIISNRVMIKDIPPYELLNKCHYWYDRGHVMLIAHELYMPQNIIVELTNKYHTDTSLGIINSKTLKTDKYIVNVADIECVRIYDHELKKYIHKPRILCAIINHNEYTFKGSDCLRKFVDLCVSIDETNMNNKDYVPLKVWFHYGGRYDVHILLSDILDKIDVTQKNPIEILDINGAFINIVQHYHSGSKIIFADSYRVCPMSLDKFQKTFVLDVGKQNLEEITGKKITEVTEYEMLNDERYIAYCMDDCKVLKKGLEALQSSTIDNYGSNALGFVSVSSYAKNLFYSKYYNINRYPLHNLNERTHKFIEKSYRGGITFLNKRGKFSNVWGYDFTSLYPWAGTQLLPYGKGKWIYDISERITTKDEQTKFLQKHPGLYECTVHNTPILHINKYVLTTISDGCLQRGPMADLTDVWTHIELLKALNAGYILTINKGIEFKFACFMADMFNNIFENKTKADREGNKGKRAVTKSLLVNGYGFMGFRKYDRQCFRVYGKNQDEQIEMMKIHGGYKFTKLDNGIQLGYGYTNVLVNDTNVAVAAYITAHARLRLLELLEDLTNAHVEVIYGDTDSVFIVGDIPANLKHKWCGINDLGEGLGELKQEYSGVIGVFSSLKMYGLKDGSIGENMYNVRMKGVSLGSNLVQIDDVPVTSISNAMAIAYEHIDDMITAGTTHTYITSYIQVGRNNKLKNTLEVMDVDVPKIVRNIYTKGKIGVDGLITPYIISPNISF